MIPKLTHTEACRLVEDSLERAIKTLAYIRLNSHRYNPDTLKNNAEFANLLCNINWYGAYLHGAKTMLRLLRDNHLCEEPHPVGALGKNGKIYVKAILDLIMSDTLHTETFLSQEYDNIHFTDHEHDKKGKVIGVKAKFYKKETKFTEI